MDASQILDEFKFDGYEGRFLTEEDLPEIYDLLEHKDDVPNKSRGRAVYFRQKKVIEKAVKEDGTFFGVFRVAQTPEEEKDLGAKKRLITIGAAYLLGENENGNPVKFAVDNSRNRGQDLVVAYEMATGYSNPLRGLPNKYGKYPKRCFGKLIIAAITLRLFQKAAKLKADTLVTNVQNRDEMIHVIGWLTSKPHSWTFIEQPTDELKNACEKTTASSTEYTKDGGKAASEPGKPDDDSNFDKSFEIEKKRYLEANSTSLQATAKCLSQVIKTGQIISDHKHEKKNLLNMDFKFDNEFVEFVEFLSSDKCNWLSVEPPEGEDSLRKLSAVVHQQMDAVARRPAPIVSEATDQTGSKKGKSNEGLRLALRETTRLFVPQDNTPSTAEASYSANTGNSKTGILGAPVTNTPSRTSAAHSRGNAVYPAKAKPPGAIRVAPGFTVLQRT